MVSASVAPVRPRTVPLSLPEFLALQAEAETDSRRLRLSQLAKQARTDAGMTQVGLAETLGLHRNTVQNWELRNGSPELHFREIEEATGKPAGWFEYQLDPYSRILDMADDIEALNGKMDLLLKTIRKLL